MMNITKNILTNNSYVIEITNENGESFIMQYGGGDVYWSMNEYTDKNEFQITREDELLFSQLENVFRQIEEYDKDYAKVLNDNKFEWISEAYGEPEVAHRLTITRGENEFTIKFFQNPKHPLRQKGFCPVCFGLSGGKNLKISAAFSYMLQEYKNYEDNVKKYNKSIQ